MKNTTVEELMQKILELSKTVESLKKNSRRETIYLPNQKPVKVNVSQEEAIVPKFPGRIDAKDFKEMELLLEEHEKKRVKLNMPKLDLTELVKPLDRDTFIDKFFDGNENNFTSSAVRQLIERESKFVNDAKKADWESEVKKALQMDFKINKTDLRIKDYLAAGKKVLRELGLIKRLSEEKFRKQYIECLIEKLKPKQLKTIIERKSKMTPALKLDLDQYTMMLQQTAEICNMVYEANTNLDNNAYKNKHAQRSARASQADAHGKNNNKEKKVWKCHVCEKEGHMFVWKRYNKQKKQYEYIKNKRCEKMLSREQEKKELEVAIKNLKDNQRAYVATNEIEKEVAEVRPIPQDASSIIQGLKNLSTLKDEEKAEIYATMSTFSVTVDVTHVMLAVKDKPTINIEIVKGSNAINIDGILDSGAQLTFIGKKEYKRIKRELKLGLVEFSLPFPIGINDANGGKSYSYFGITVDIKIDVEKSKVLTLRNATAYIVDNENFKKTLVGEDLLHAAGLMPYQNIKPGEIILDPDSGNKKSWDKIRADLAAPDDGPDEF